MSFEKIYTIKNPNNETIILGVNNSNLKMFESYFDCLITYRNFDFYSDSSNDVTSRISYFLEYIESMLNKQVKLTGRDFNYILKALDNHKEELINELFYNNNTIITLQTGKQIAPKTLKQLEYVKALENNTIVFGLGPAGTGKTYLATLYAVKLLKANRIKKIVLVRPVVEAGERLGFLPGDLKEKIDPYLIPLYDCLYDSLGKEKVENLIQKGIIEVAPLAYMRGRTLENACIILDEAQNTTTSQMKMFLTRLGFNSKMYITGDVTQIDLDNKRNSGLIEASNLLQEIDDIKFIEFDRSDVMRHPLVNKIIKRYDLREYSNN